MEDQKSRILVIGGTGYIGKFIVKASSVGGHPTFVLVREGTATDPSKSRLLGEFTASGVTLVQGDLNDHESLVRAIKGVDVVISTVGRAQLADQFKIIAAIKEAGNVKRFLPSEFGADTDHSNAVEPFRTTLGIKSQIRRAIEAEKIPHTYVSSFFFFSCFLPSIAQANTKSLPVDKISILGDGNIKAISNYEEDIATYTIKAVDDPRTLNKILYLRPSGNIYSHNELVSLWEKKTGKTFERVYVSEEDVLEKIQGAPMPLNLVLAIHHSAFVKVDDTNFEIDPSNGVEATALYPEVKYTTVDEYLSRFL